MPAIELTYPTSVLGLFCGDGSTRDVLSSMTDQLPSRGLAAPKVRRRLDLLQATCRLLDSRILESAATVLDQDIARPLVAWLAAYQNLREAAAKTLAGEEVAVVVLEEPVPFTTSQDVDVAVVIDDDEIARFAFRLEVRVDLGKVSVAVRHGAIDEVVCALAGATASFTVEGSPKPLWKPEAVSAPEVHLAVRPPFAVPLVEVPRPRRPAAPPPQHSAQRPPMPGQSTRRS